MNCQSIRVLVAAKLFANVTRQVLLALWQQELEQWFLTFFRILNSLELISNAFAETLESATRDRPILLFWGR